MLADLSAEDRLKIIYALNSRPMSLSELSKEFDIPDSESSRQLQRLCNSQLVKRRIDGNYQMTNYGKTILSFLPLMDTSARNSEFIDNHDLFSLPVSSQRRLDELFRAELSTDFLSSQSRTLEHFNGAKGNAHFAGPQIPEFAMPTVYKKLKDGIKVRAVFSRLAIDTAGREYLDILEGMELRVLKTVPLTLDLFDKFAAVALPGLDGNPDRNNIYLGSDPIFIGWNRELFENLWSRAKPFETP